MNKLIRAIKIFVFKGEKYIVHEIGINVPSFTGCCMKKDGFIVCYINYNLKPIEKQNTLHRLIKRKKLRRA